LSNEEGDFAMREPIKRFFFKDADGVHEVYNFVASTVRRSEQNGRTAYVCHPIPVEDPDSVGLEVSIWNTDRQDVNDWLVHHAYGGEIKIEQERPGEVWGTLYLEADPLRWHRPEDAPWRHQQEREEPWPIPMSMGRRFLRELWRKLCDDWLTNLSKPQKATHGFTPPSRLC
jgi:hypothetical protein